MSHITGIPEAAGSIVVGRAFYDITSSLSVSFQYECGRQNMQKILKQWLEDFPDEEKRRTAQKYKNLQQLADTVEQLNRSWRTRYLLNSVATSRKFNSESFELFDRVRSLSQQIEAKRTILNVPGFREEDSQAHTNSDEDSVQTPRLSVSTSASHPSQERTDRPMSSVGAQQRNQSALGSYMESVVEEHEMAVIHPGRNRRYSQ